MFTVKRPGGPAARRSAPPAGEQRGVPSGRASSVCAHPGKEWCAPFETRRTKNSRASGPAGTFRPKAPCRREPPRKGAALDEKDWIILKTLQEKRNITKTAAAVYISQPALSKRLQQLEERFGVSIAIRSKSGIELTPAGEYLARCSSQFLDTMRGIQEYLDNMGGSVQGTLRIGASYFCTKYILPDLLMRFKEAFPQVEFQLASSWSSNIGKMVQDRDIHVGFIRNDHVAAEEKYLLLRERNYICCKRKLSLDTLPDEPQISYKTDSLIKSALEVWWNEQYTRPPRIAMEVDRVGTSADMVERGLGYAILSEILADRIGDVWKHELRHKDGTPYYRHSWLVTNQDAKQLTLVDRFIRFSLEHFAGEVLR